MPQVGILTFHNANNFGALLQTFALQNTLKGLNCDVTILNYHNQFVSAPLKKPNWLNYRNYVKYFQDLAEYKNTLCKNNKFQQFSHNYLNLSELIEPKDLMSIGEFYDMVFCGSDQIWNNSITGNDYHYYLDFIPSKKKCSYAASIGKERLSNEDLPKVLSLLSDFRTISVREESAKNALKDQIGIESQRVLDPTLLLKPQDYKRLIKHSNLNLKKPYILVYMLVYSKTLLKSAHRLSENTKLPVYIINASGKRMKGKNIFSDISIEDWLFLFANSSYILTNSFHGTAFSINFHKPFFVELLPDRINANSRLKDILNLFKLEDRLISNGKVNNKKMNFSEVDEILEKERKYSYDFLRKSLEGHYIPQKQKEECSILRTPNEYCSGCTLCKEICPVNAIEMDTNINGFLYPKIQYDKCIQCGKCVNFCPFNNYQFTDKNKIPNHIYAANSKSTEIINKSSSGGAFYELASFILKKQGHVYGAAFTSDFKLKHKCVDSINQLDSLMGSKYVQSEMIGILDSIHEDLGKNKFVLFVGTPCQVAAVQEFCRDCNNTLYTCDLVCHGVPSPKLLTSYLDYCAQYFRSPIKNYIPRSKVMGWAHNEVLEFENGKIEYKHPVSQSYKKIFHSSLGLRQSCYHCPFATLDRVGDLSLADYWGIEIQRPDLYRENGVSMILVNSEKGEQLLNQVNNLNLAETSLETIIESKQIHLFRPISLLPQTEKFWIEFHRYGWKYLIKNYAECDELSLFKWKLKRILKYVSK